MIFDASLQLECPDIVRKASACKVLTKDEEYRLIEQAQLSIKPRPATWFNRPARILTTYPTQLARKPKTTAGLKRLVRLGDIAITKLIEHNYRLIISIAKKFQGRGLSWSDLIQHGSDGFVYAVAKFNLGTGNKLSTYATQWIRQRISRAIENTSRAIRIPIHMQSKINEIKYIYRKFLERDEGAPSSEEIAQIYNLNSRKKKNFQPITKEEAEELGRHMQNITSLNESAGDDENLTILDYIRDACPGPEGDVEVDMDKQELNRLIVQLPREDQVFIKFKYGLVDGAPKSDAKAAQAFSIPIKQVKEIETNILAQLNAFANPARTNLDKEIEVFSVLVLDLGGGALTKEEASVLMGVEIPAIPCKIYESTDRDQMLVMKVKLEALGARAEVISSF